MAQETMTKQQKRTLIDEAWTDYRAKSQALPRTLPYSGYKRRDGTAVEGFLEQDERLWRRYLSAEREIASVPEPKAA